MRPNAVLAFVLACCCLALLASPALSEEAETRADAPDAADTTPPASGTVPDIAPDPILLSSCFVQIECDDGSIVSCSGNNTCSTGGTNNRCVVCDGVQGACCPKTCCEVCLQNLDNCLNCSPRPPHLCDNVYDYCVGNCTGGCP